jgi:sugar phosphate isomerase/epimerase
MKLGVLTVLLQEMSAEEAFKYLAGLGVQAVELGAGGYPGSSHLKAEELAGNKAKISSFKDLLSKYNLSVSALSCHGNPVHPDSGRAKADHEVFLRTCGLAEALGADTVVTFSGCPGDGGSGTTPNWVTSAWPPEFPKLLDWQWNEVLIPYWKNAVDAAASRGIRKIALEMHPGFMVYNPKALLRLRQAVGPAIGANFDPSHLMWQGIDAAAAIRALAGAVYHVHAKDTQIDPVVSSVNGVLETGSFERPASRSWNFRTVGWGHDAKYWKGLITALRLTGYDGTISIEHEDVLMSPREGLEKAVTFLKDIVIREAPGQAYWA